MKTPAAIQKEILLLTYRFLITLLLQHQPQYHRKSKVSPDGSRWSGEKEGAEDGQWRLSCGALRSSQASSGALGPTWRLGLSQLSLSHRRQQDGVAGCVSNIYAWIARAKGTTKHHCHQLLEIINVSYLLFEKMKNKHNKSYCPWNVTLCSQYLEIYRYISTRNNTMKFFLLKITLYLQ